VQCEPLGNKQLKGFHHPVAVYAVLARNRRGDNNNM
jgi:hypothetical protein